MTSVKYYVNWLKEAGRGHVTAFFSWAGFFIYTLSAFFGLQTNTDACFFGIGNERLLYLCAGLGVFSAAAEFWYLEQPVKLDFYYSLPVKREVIFWCRYVHGILHFVPALTVSMILSGFYECGIDTEFLAYADVYVIRSIFVFTAVFFIFYHICVFALLAGGRIVSAVLFFSVIVFFSQAVFKGIGEAYADHFFQTYYRIPFLERLKEVLAPWLLAQRLAGAAIYDRREALTYLPEQADVFAAALWIVLFGLFIFCLQKRRKVENVGKLFAFAGVERAVVFLFSIILSLCLGIFFTGSAIVLVFLVHLLSEGLIQRKKEALFQRKGQLIVEAALVCLVTGGFLAGAGFFDDFIPEKEKLGAIRICVNGLDMSYEEASQNLFGKESYGVERKLAKYKFTEEGLAESLSWLASLKERTDVKPETFATVCYQMKDGTEKYRAYPVDGEGLQAFSRVFETGEYKEKAYPAVLWEDVGENRFTWIDGVSERALKLTGEEKEAFLKKYKEEILKLKMSELTTAAPVGAVVMSSDKWGEKETLVIYPFLRETCEFLRSFEGVKMDLSEYDVRELRVIDVGAADNALSGGVIKETYEAPEEILKWKGKLVWKELDIQSLLYPLDYEREVEAEAVEPESGAVTEIKCFPEKSE